MNFADVIHARSGLSRRLLPAVGCHIGDAMQATSIAYRRYDTVTGTMADTRAILCQHRFRRESASSRACLYDRCLLVFYCGLFMASIRLCGRMSVQ